MRLLLREERTQRHDRVHGVHAMTTPVRRRQVPLRLLRGEVNIMNIRYSSLIALASIIGALFVYGACSSDTPSPKATRTAAPRRSSSGQSSTGGPQQPLPDAGTLPDGAPSDCYATPDPTTNFQIINGCTDADKIARNPVLAKLLSDGGLPPLQ